jgi:hypothetical protein
VFDRHDQAPPIGLERGRCEQRFLHLLATVAALTQAAGEGLQLKELQPLWRAYLHVAPAVSPNAVDAFGTGM